MKEENKKILQSLQSSEIFDNQNILNLFVGELCVKQHLSHDADFIVNKEVTLKEKKLAVFDFLKITNDNVMNDIENIFNKHNWYDALLIIRAGCNNEEKPHLFGGIKQPAPYFTGRQDKIDEIHKIIDENCGLPKGQRENNCVVISGLGGIGKTQLVRSYIQKYKCYFDSIIWINAEKETTFYSSFSSLANKLEISEQGTFEELAKLISQKISSFGRKIIFIFDNCDEIFPHKMLPLVYEKYFSLITSRFGDKIWRNDEFSGEIIQLGAFTVDEANRFIENSFKDLKKPGILDGNDELAKELEYFPLALRQAVCYIGMQNKLNCNGLYTCKKYLVDFNDKVENTIKLLEFVPKEISLNKEKYPSITVKNTLNIWQITFEKIGEIPYEECKLDNKINSKPLQVTILNLCAYLVSDSIPVNLFLNKAQDEKHLLWAIEILETFSLIEFNNNGILKIHKLIQHVTRINLLQKNVYEENLIAIAELIIAKYPDDSQISADYSEKDLFPHLMKLKDSILNALKDSNVEKQIQQEKLKNILCSMLETIADISFKIGEMTILESVREELLTYQEKFYGVDDIQIVAALQNLSIAYYYLCKTRQAKSICERALEIQQRHYGFDHVDVSITLAILALVYGELGDKQMMKVILKTALNIQECYSDPDRFKLARILTILAVVHGGLGDQQKKKMMLERALHIQERHYGPNHFELAIILVELAIAYGELGDQGTKKTTLERALNIQECHYGHNHFKLARILVNLAIAHGELGDQGTKKTILERALNIQECHYGRDHFELARTLMELAMVHRKLGYQQTHTEMLGRALKIKERHYGPDHFELAVTLMQSA